MSQKNIKVLFHSNCHDGFAAALCAWRKFGSEAKYIPVRHQEPIPESINFGDVVYILDFSYPRAELEEIMAMAKEVTVLDHHKTAQEQLLGLSNAIFNLNKSGAELAWSYWNPDTPCPDLIRYVGDRDLWKKELPYSERVHLALRSFPLDFFVWNELLKMNNYVEFMKIIGKSLLEKRNSEIEEILLTAEIKEFLGYKVTVLNTDHWDLISDACNQLCEEHPECDFSLNYFPSTKDPNQIRFSLRSVGDFDVSALAVKYGGGGHLNAAGFKVEKDFVIALGWLV